MGHYNSFENIKYWFKKKKKKTQQEKEKEKSDLSWVGRRSSMPEYSKGALEILGKPLYC